MSDIFLSYAHEDEDRVRPIVQQLESQGWSVFWDRNIPPGKSWDEYIEQHLEAAHCVVVAWSKNSVNSRYVLAEAEEGKNRNILVPLLLDEVKLRLGFRYIQAADLKKWNNDASLPQFKACIDAISAFVPKPVNPTLVPYDVSVTPVVQNVADENLPENFVLIKGGTFSMGSPENEVERHKDETQHEVKLSDFAMCKYAVTAADFRRFAEENGYQTDAEKENWSYIFGGKELVKKEGINWRHDTSGHERPASEYNHPVLHVSWNDAAAYCEWLSKKQGGWVYRLPTEAEWECACRAGTTTPFSTGENLTTDQANYNGNYPYGSNPKGVFRKKTVPVDAFHPNGFGLYNMHGNVWEWCSDWHGEKYYEECRKKGVEENPQGPSSGSSRVLRGGSLNSGARGCRSASRDSGYPGNRIGHVGFRLVLVPQFSAAHPAKGE
jgi:formylglycine-generating enzyme required for sulfatase activity